MQKQPLKTPLAYFLQSEIIKQNYHPHDWFASDGVDRLEDWRNSPGLAFDSLQS
jgi:hypothetical protein